MQDIIFNNFTDNSISKNLYYLKKQSDNLFSDAKIIYTANQPLEKFVIIDYNSDELLDVLYYDNNENSLNCDCLKLPFEKPNEPSKIYYDFNGWYIDENFNDKFDFNYIPEDSNINLYAKWQPQNYSIDYNLNGGKLNEANPTAFNINSKLIKFNEPIKSGYKFVGWKTQDNEILKEIDTASYDLKNLELTAQWKIETHKILYKNINGADNSANPIEFSSLDGEITLFQPTKQGYSFLGWQEGDKVDCNLCEDVVKTALWEILKYKISYNLNDGVNNQDNPSDYNIEQAQIILKEPTRKGYKFLGWQGGNAINCDICKNIVKTAQWEILNYNITYILNGGVNNRDNPTNYNIDQAEIVLKEPTKDGYNFLGWQESETIDCTLCEDIVKTAEWEEIKCEAIFKNWDGEILSQKYYEMGQYINKPEIPERNSDFKFSYNFIGWNYQNFIAKNQQQIYIAQYDKKHIEYTIKFLSYDGTNIKALKVHYGDLISNQVPQNDEVINRPQDDINIYIFNGWGPNFENTCSKNAVYEPTYITRTKILENESDGIVASIINSNGFETNSKLVIKQIDDSNIDFESALGKKNKICKIMNASMYIGDEKMQSNYTGIYNIKIKTPCLKESQYVKILINQNNQIIEKQAIVKDGFIIFDTNELGDFAIVRERTSLPSWCWVVIVLASIIVILFLTIIIFYLLKLKKFKKINI